MSRVTQFLVAAVFLLGTSSAFAEDIKLGYVDMQRALNETDDGRKAKEKLKKDFDMDAHPTASFELRGVKDVVRDGTKFKHRAIIFSQLDGHA